MKRKAIALLIILLVMNFMSVAFAIDDEKYFKGDKNYILCGAGMGAGFFVDRNSLKVEKYDPPIYILSIDILDAGYYFMDRSKSRLHRRHTDRFMYDYSKREMYLYTPDGGNDMKWRYENNYRSNTEKLNKKIDWNSQWTYVDPDVYYGEGAVFPTAGEIAFALAYGIKFHGNKYRAFQGDFYDRIGNVKDDVQIEFKNDGYDITNKTYHSNKEYGTMEWDVSPRESMQVNYMYGDKNYPVVGSVEGGSVFLDIKSCNYYVADNKAYLSCIVYYSGGGADGHGNAAKHSGYTVRFSTFKQNGKRVIKFLEEISIKTGKENTDNAYKYDNGFLHSLFWKVAGYTGLKRYLD